MLSAMECDVLAKEIVKDIWNRGIEASEGAVPEELPVFNPIAPQGWNAQGWNEARKETLQNLQALRLK